MNKPSEISTGQLYVRLPAETRIAVLKYEGSVAEQTGQKITHDDAVDRLLRTHPALSQYYVKNTESRVGDKK